MSTQAPGKKSGDGLYVVTANNLLTGDVVFRHPDGSWTSAIDEALVLQTRDKGFVQLADAQNDERANIVIAPVLIEVTVEAGAIRPVHIRERIRALGPTVRPDLARTASGFLINAVEERS